MKNLSDRKLGERKKVLVIGDSGSGKTRLLGTFPGPVYVADVDNGLDSLAGRDILYDEFHDAQGQKPTAWLSLKKKIAEWRQAPQGATFALDSITTAGDAALRYVLDRNGRAQAKIQIGDWGDAITEVKDLLGYLTTLPCNVVVTAHYQTVVDNEGGGVYFAPLIFGKDLPPRMPMYFNDTWRTFVETKLGSSDPVYKLQVRPSTKYSTLKNSLGLKEMFYEPDFAALLKAAGENK